MAKNMGGRGRPGGNPDFGTKYKFDYGNEEKKTEALTIRVTPRFLEEIKKAGGDRYRDFCRDAIVEKLGREVAALQTKIAATGLETETGREPGDNQTTQATQEQAIDPTPQEQATTPKRRRKATSSQGQKPTKPKSQSRSRKSSATEKPQEQGQLDTGN